MTGTALVEHFDGRLAILYWTEREAIPVLEAPGQFPAAHRSTGRSQAAGRRAVSRYAPKKRDPVTAARYQNWPPRRPCRRSNSRARQAGRILRCVRRTRAIV